MPTSLIKTSAVLLGGAKTKAAKTKAIAPSYQGNSAMATHYRTSLTTLMLETYYRLLPATGENAIH